jgi:hypothetical protein
VEGIQHILLIREAPVMVFGHDGPVYRPILRLNETYTVRDGLLETLVAALRRVVDMDDLVLTALPVVALEVCLVIGEEQFSARQETLLIRPATRVPEGDIYRLLEAR